VVIFGTGRSSPAGAAYRRSDMGGYLVECHI
jgi:hypothetical protein